MAGRPMSFESPKLPERWTCLSTQQTTNATNNAAFLRPICWVWYHAVLCIAVQNFSLLQRLAASMSKSATLNLDTSDTLPARDAIELTGVRVHNLKNIDVRIRYQALTVVCGVSGSGKSSLAFDTLYAEGQRRYVETFSPYLRQFMDRVERPDADRIDGMPPAIAIRQNANRSGSFSTVGTRTEVYESLRHLFSACGTLNCDACQQPAERMNSDSVTRFLIQEFDGCRAMLVFRITEPGTAPSEAERQQLLEDGFSRCLVNGETRSTESLLECNEDTLTDVAVVADRIKIHHEAEARIRESIEAAFRAGSGTFDALVQHTPEETTAVSNVETIDGHSWIRQTFHFGLQCVGCGRTFGDPTAESLNFQSAAGACPTCEGSGQVSGMTFDKVVPDDRMSLQEGAIQPWTTPAYRHELEELLALADACGIPTDVPFRQLQSHHRKLILDGVPEYGFGGLNGFHRWLVRNRYKKGVSVVLNRWRSWLPCPDCDGKRIKQTGGTLVLEQRSLADATTMQVSELWDWWQRVDNGLDEEKKRATQVIRGQLNHRLTFLMESGLGYLSLDRSLKTLSGGEAQRVILTAALGSGLVNTLYVLDEPTCGLHPDDAAKVLKSVKRLQQHGNTVVVVEHDPEFIAAADEVIEIGPAAGQQGGELVFQGTAEQLRAADTATGEALRKSFRKDGAGPSDVAAAEARETESRQAREAGSWLTFSDVDCHNINGLDVRLPLGIITVVTGVSGSGKSSLLVDSLYPALCREKGLVPERDIQGQVGKLIGADQLQDIQILDQSPIRTSRRSIPATLLNCFDEIRKVLADTHEAKKRNFKPGMFSFNSSAGGRCEHCEGLGQVTVEMQFLADIQTTCEACSGKRFRRDVLEVRYRDRNIDDILNMTVDDAFTFFHNQKKIQQKLNSIRQAGLGYLRLGQPVSTLSGGEAQRLRIASLLAGIPLSSETASAVSTSRSSEKSRGTLFILDEPSTGLHVQDIARLMKCLHYLVDIGHTIWIIEHDQAVVDEADYILQMGPGPGTEGGRIVQSTFRTSMSGLADG